MKCVRCWTIGMNTITDYVYAGYTLCEYHIYCLARQMEREAMRAKAHYFKQFEAIK